MSPYRSVSSTTSSSIFDAIGSNNEEIIKIQPYYGPLDFSIDTNENNDNDNNKNKNMINNVLCTNNKNYNNNNENDNEELILRRRANNYNWMNNDQYFNNIANTNTSKKKVKIKRSNNRYNERLMKKSSLFDSHSYYHEIDSYGDNRLRTSSSSTTPPMIVPYHGKLTFPKDDTNNKIKISSNHTTIGGDKSTTLNNSFYLFFDNNNNRSLIICYYVMIISLFILITIALFVIMKKRSTLSKEVKIKQNKLNKKQNKKKKKKRKKQKNITTHAAPTISTTASLTIENPNDNDSGNINYESEKQNVNDISNLQSDNNNNYNTNNNDDNTNVCQTLDKIKQDGNNINEQEALLLLRSLTSISEHVSSDGIKDNNSLHNIMNQSTTTVIDEYRKYKEDIILNDMICNLHSSRSVLFKDAIIQAQSKFWNTLIKIFPESIIFSLLVRNIFSSSYSNWIHNIKYTYEIIIHFFCITMYEIKDFSTVCSMICQCNYENQVLLSSDSSNLINNQNNNNAIFNMANTTSLSYLQQKIFNYLNDYNPVLYMFPSSFYYQDSLSLLPSNTYCYTTCAIKYIIILSFVSFLHKLLSFFYLPTYIHRCLNVTSILLCIFDYNFLINTLSVPQLWIAVLGVDLVAVILSILWWLFDWKPKSNNILDECAFHHDHTGDIMNNNMNRKVAIDTIRKMEKIIYFVSIGNSFILGFVFRSRND